MNAPDNVSPVPTRDADPLASFGRPIRAVIIGAGGGIGSALAEALADNPVVERVHALSRRPVSFPAGKVRHGAINLEDERSIADAATAIAAHSGTVDLIIVATGLLHDDHALQPEKSWKVLNAEQLAKSFEVNTIGPLLAAKHFLPLLGRAQKSVFAALSARVGSIEDNRLGGWYGYRASKAALNMSIRSLAIELGRTHPNAVCLSLHPGTVDTKLSKPFQRGAPKGVLQIPASCAAKLLRVIDRASPDDTGRFFAYDGAPIPF